MAPAISRWTIAAGLAVVLALGVGTGAIGRGDPADAQPQRATKSRPAAGAQPDGRPPVVPHDVEGRRAICQECHATGDQGAPIAPHPTRTHFCVACHVGQDTSAKPFPPR